MCGIFGVVCASGDPADRELARSLIVSLLRFSETRGREAVGIAVHDGERIQVLKRAGSVTEFLRDGELTALLDRVRDAKPGMTLAITGHSRLACNGTQSNGDNNQPVITRGSVALHNGIVVDDAALAERYQLARQGDLDTEVLATVLRGKLDRTGDLVTATRETFAEIEGSASIAMFFDDLDALLLATNTGSLFQVANHEGTMLLFASERFILQRALEDGGTAKRFGAVLEQVEAGHALVVKLKDLDRVAFSLTGAGGPEGMKPNGHRVEIVEHARTTDHLQRCTKCILPSTYPYIDFDKHGVCRYCRNWKKITPKGEQALLDMVEPYRRKDGKPDVIVAFSGGRDSSYGLHYVKKVLGMNPVAFTYDW
ncbi:MAG: hypothetical protein ABI867_24260, partial [Kofleriaceae bacterium]